MPLLNFLAARQLYLARRHDTIRELADDIEENRRRCPVASMLVEFLLARSKDARGWTADVLEQMATRVERYAENGQDLPLELAAEWQRQAVALVAHSLEMER